jgi:hypothetical protein
VFLIISVGLVFGVVTLVVWLLRLRHTDEGRTGPPPAWGERTDD